MNIEQMVSGCQALFNSAIDSSFLKTYLLILFLAIPLFKSFTSILKTKRKITYLLNGCETKVPKKLEKLAQKHGVDQEKILISCKQDLIAMSLGFFDKRILFSKSIVSKLSDKELEAVFLHELHHMKSNHAFMLLVGKVISETIFFFPMFKDIYMMMRSQFEKKADSAAVDYQKTNKYVKKSLLKLLDQNNEFGLYPQFSYLVLDQRLGNLNNEKQKMIFSFKRTVFSFVFIFSFAVLAHLSSNRAMASLIEEKIECSFFECAKICVVDEILIRKKLMSPVNFSFSPQK